MGVGMLLRRDFSFPQIKVVFPQAPLQPYTPLDGDESNVWFDRLAISAQVPEHSDSVERIGVDVKNLIKRENDLGIPNDRIVVGE
jgi:phospholipase/carboxylesterase